MAAPLGPARPRRLSSQLREVLCGNKCDNSASQCGLQNLGNSCFMNAALQTMMHCGPFERYLFFKHHSKRKCSYNKYCSLCELERLASFCAQSASNSISPDGFFRNLTTLSSHFRIGAQEDCHEFLRYLIDNMITSSATQYACGRRLSLDVIEESPMHQIFGGYFHSRVTCDECGKDSNTFDPFYDVSMELSGESVEDCLRHFFGAEQLDVSNQYTCTRCKKHVPATKQMYIARLPNVMTVHLKRFGSGMGSPGIFGGLGRKISKPVLFPEILELKPFESPISECQASNFAGDGSTSYRLNGVVVHSGPSSMSGHYFAYCRCSDGKWRQFDDSRVTEVSLNDVFKETGAYLLMYERQKYSFDAFGCTVREPSFNIEHHQADPDDNRSGNLIVTVSLPRSESMENADLNVERTKLKLESDDYNLILGLPVPVLADACKAKFKKKHRLLILTLPIEPRSE